MPYDIKYLDDEGGIITTYSGSITYIDLVNCTAERAGQIAKKPYKYSIGDYTTVTNLELSSEEIQKQAETVSKLLANNKDLLIALVMPSILKFGIGRMWQAYLEIYMNKHANGAHPNISVFKTRTEAETWVKEKR